jgi:aminopeptidase
MSVEAYANEIAAACFLKRRDPVSHWEALFRKARDIKRRLNRLKVTAFHLESSQIDLKITPGAHRRWIGLTGHNIPSFEIFLSPDWHGTSGTYYADQPSYRSGNTVKGVRLEFKKGRVVSASAEAGEAFLKSQLAMDPGARRLGEFSLTDKRFSKIRRFMANTLFDENYGGRHGNCHVALGSAYADTYKGNPSELTKARKAALGFNDSALHWDLVNTRKKRVIAHLAGGRRRTVYEDGKFTI